MTRQAAWLSGKEAGGLHEFACVRRRRCARRRLNCFYLHFYSPLHWFGASRGFAAGAFTGADNTFNKTGFIGGGQIGANWQIDALVLGIEGDFDWTGLKGSTHDSLANTINTDTQWTSTVTGRIGAAFDRLLVYAKGGVAFAHDKDSLNDTFGNTATASLTRTGWTAGAGLEYAFAPNWTARIEYDYLGFGNETLNLSTPTTPAYSTNTSLNVQEVKAGINFKFGP